MTIFFLVMIFPNTVKLYAQASGAVIFRDDFNRSNLGNAWQTDGWYIKNGSAFNGNGGPLRTAAYFNDSSYVIETSQGALLTTITANSG